MARGTNYARANSFALLLIKLDDSLGCFHAVHVWHADVREYELISDAKLKCRLDAPDGLLAIHGHVDDLFHVHLAGSEEGAETHKAKRFVVDNQDPLPIFLEVVQLVVNTLLQVFVRSFALGRGLRLV